MAKPFHADIRHWPTLQSFMAHLAAHQPSIAPWARGVTIHHTDGGITSWRGLASMQNHISFYRDVRNWDRGPHLFVALGARAKKDDGIWQLTPLNLPGVHAGDCNDDHWGIEVVGKYDRAAWSQPLRELVYGVSAALLRWRDLPANRATVNGHRECLPNKTCPGNAINMDAVRADLATLLHMPPPSHPPIRPPWQGLRYKVVRPNTWVRDAPNTKTAKALGRLQPPMEVVGDLRLGEVFRGVEDWLAITYQGKQGFVWLGQLERVL